MHRVVWTANAEDDLERLLAYYLNEAGIEVAESVHQRLREQVGSLKLFPERCRPGRVPGTREFVLARLPYIAVVLVDHKQVTILAVVHTARKFPSP